MKKAIHIRFYQAAVLLITLLLCIALAGASGEKLSKEKRSLLYTVFNQNDVTTMKRLLDEGMDVDADMGSGMTLLLKVANIGTPEIVNLLIQRGADVNHTLKSGKNTLLTALSNSKHYDTIVPLLIEAGVDVNAKITKNGYNAVWLTTSKIKQGFPKEPGVLILKKLLSKGADPNARFISKDKKYAGMTPLMTISKKGQLYVVKLLLAYGARADLATEEGKKAVDFAREKNKKDVVDFLSSWNPSKRTSLKKEIQPKEIIGPDGKDSILETCKGDPREPWCYQEAVEKLGDQDLCENILKYWPNAIGVHGWCYYRLGVLTRDCHLCTQIKKQDIKKMCQRDVCK